MKKYAVLECNGKEYIFVFDKSIQHNYFFGHIEDIRPDFSFDMLTSSKVISAGFVSDDGKCFGRSETLNKDSRPKEDTKLFAEQV